MKAKKILFVCITILSLNQLASAQWQYESSWGWIGLYTYDKVGIGIKNTDPFSEFKLDVNGNLKIRGFTLEHQGADFKLGTNDGRSVGNKPLQRALAHVGTGGVDNLGDALLINVAGDFEGGVRIHGPGASIDKKLGVDTWYIPNGYKLAVNGKIICTGLSVKLKNVWPDYVFAIDYKRLALEEVSQFILKNGHLPGMPSAADIEAVGGVEVGEMQRLLLEKVEELTLYMIELKEENKALKQEIGELKKM